MRTLSLGVFGEGPTDIDFLSPVLLRFATDLILKKGTHPAQVADPIALPGRPSTDSFRNAVETHAPSFDVLVVHTDANGNFERAMADRIGKWFALVPESVSPEKCLMVPAVPQRETEAWMLCDMEALNSVLGTRKTRREFGLPNHPRDVERITEPKDLLRDIQRMAVGKRRARRIGLRPLYASLGQEISLTHLQTVPTFTRFASEFEYALRRVGFLPPAPAVTTMP